VLPSDILVEVRDKNLKRWGQIRPQDLDLKAIKIDLGVGEWTLRLPTEHPMVPYLRTPGSGIIIYIRQKRFMSGSCISPTETASPEDPGGVVTFNGVDDNDIISGAVSLPDPTRTYEQQATESHDIVQGKAETVMKSFVRRNIGQDAISSRRTGLRQYLRTATDLARGPVVTREERFTNLGVIEGEVATYAGLGFDTGQVGNEIVFDVFERRDRTKFVRFDVRNGTLSEETVAISAPNVTRPIVLGQGQGTDRQVVARTTPVSVAAEAAWARPREVVYDQRQTSDVTVLEQKAYEALETDGFTATNVKAVPADENTMRYLEDWREGDKITIVVQGKETVATVTKVSLVANSSGVAIGSAIGDVSGFDAAAALNKRVEDTEKRISSLERNTEAAAGGTLAGGTDLNNLLTLGKFFIPDAALSNTLKHLPVPPAGAFRSGSTGILYVESAGNNRVIQRFDVMGRPGVPQMFPHVRVRGSDGVWGPWLLERHSLGVANDQERFLIATQCSAPSMHSPLEFVQTDWVPNTTTTVGANRALARHVTVDGVQWHDGSGNREYSPSWVALAYAPNWSDYSTGTSWGTGPQVIRTSAGIIIMRNLVKPASTAQIGSVITTLPDGYRPARLVRIVTVNGANNGGSIVYVWPDGRVTWEGAFQNNIGFVSLYQVMFPAADVAPVSAWTPATVLPGWTAVPGDGPAYWQDQFGRVWNTGGVTWGGGNTSPTSDTPMIQYPAEFAASGQEHMPALGLGASLYYAPLDYTAAAQLRFKAGAVAGAAAAVYISNVVLFPAAKIPDNLWRVPGYVSSWKAYNAATHPSPSFWSSPDGIQHWRGLAGAGTAPPSTMTTPRGVNDRQLAGMSLLHLVSSVNSPARITVQPDYALAAQSGSSQWMSLYGVFWFLEG
jgi:hypothetical protein